MKKVMLAAIALLVGAAVFCGCAGQPDYLDWTDAEWYAADSRQKSEAFYALLEEIDRQTGGSMADDPAAYPGEMMLLEDYLHAMPGITIREVAEQMAEFGMDGIYPTE